MEIVKVDARKAIKLAEGFVRHREEVQLDPEDGTVKDGITLRIVNSKFVGNDYEGNYVVETAYRLIEEDSKEFDCGVYQVFIPDDATDADVWFDHNVL